MNDYVNPEHKQVHLEVGKHSAEIDEEIVPLITELWKADIATLNSCQDFPDAPNPDMVFLVCFGEGFTKILDVVGCKTELHFELWYSMADIENHDDKMKSIIRMLIPKQDISLLTKLFKNWNEQVNVTA